MPFEPRRYIDAVAVDVAVLDDNVAQIDADAVLDPLVVRDGTVPFGHTPLDSNRTGDGFNYARKLDQDAIAGGLNDAAFVLGNLPVDQVTAERS